MRQFSFEKLNVWQKSRTLSVLVYNITKRYPIEEKFGLMSQMRRSTMSIASNIAEGSGRHTAKDKARFTEIAYSSALELLSQSIISADLDYIKQEELKEIKLKLSEITAMLDGLYKAQLNS